MWLLRSEVCVGVGIGRWADGRLTSGSVGPVVVHRLSERLRRRRRRRRRRLLNVGRTHTLFMLVPSRFLGGTSKSTSTSIVRHSTTAAAAAAATATRARR